MTTLQTATKELTAEEFYSWANCPENWDKVCELEEGVIVEMSRPGKRHGLVCANVCGVLRNYVISRGRGYIRSKDTGIIVLRNPDTVRGPDVLLFDDATDVDEVEEKYGETPPLLAVEVLSPNDTHGVIMPRVIQLRSFGVKLVWVIDPDARTVIVHGHGGDRAVKDDQELTGNGILEGFACRVAEFFDLPAKAQAKAPS